MVSGCSRAPLKQHLERCRHKYRFRVSFVRGHRLTTAPLLLVEQQLPQGVLVCDHTGLVINRFSLSPQRVKYFRRNKENASLARNPMDEIPKYIPKEDRIPVKIPHDAAMVRRLKGTRLVIMSYI